MLIQIDYKETYLRKLVKEAGGRWDGEKKLWEIPYYPYKDVVQLGLKNIMQMYEIQKMSVIRNIFKGLSF